MKQLKNFLIKREQSQARLSFAKREKSRLLAKTLLTLVALLAVTTGAWAEEQSETFTTTATIVEGTHFTISNNDDYADSDGMTAKSGITVTPKNGETITKVVISCTWDPGHVNNGNTSVSSGTKEITNGGGTITVTGVNASTFTFTCSNGDPEFGQFVVYYTEASPASSGPEVAWTAASKTGTFTMPGDNVTVSVEYYDLATLADKGLTAAEDAAAKTEAPLAVLAENAITGGTVMYYVAPDANFSQADAIALPETAWSADIPTAETIEAEGGTCYVWYYIKGDDEHSDTDPQRLAVTVLPEPTYAVELAEGTEESDKWTVKAGTDGSFQSLPLKGVKAGTKVKLKYDGDRSMLKAVKAEKKAAAPAYTLLSAAATSDVGKVVCAAGHLHDAKTAVPDGCTAVGILGKVTTTGHGLILALHYSYFQDWYTINGWTSASYAGTTLKVLPDDARDTNLTSYTALGETAVSNWAVAQKSDYVAIFTNLGSTTGNSDGMTYDGNVNAYITTGVGGTALSGDYWSATDDDDDPWFFSGNSWSHYDKGQSIFVWPVLGF